MVGVLGSALTRTWIVHPLAAALAVAAPIPEGCTGVDPGMDPN